jgi:hypothetical protein
MDVSAMDEDYSSNHLIVTRYVTHRNDSTNLKSDHTGDWVRTSSVICCPYLVMPQFLYRGRLQMIG